MPRLRQVPRSEVTSEVVLEMYNQLFGDRDPVEQPGTATGTPGNWWTVFALAPDIMDHAVLGFGLGRADTRQIDSRHRELGQTRAGWLRGSQFVFSQHCKSSRARGIPEEKITALPHWQVADCFSPTERALLAYTDALVLDGGRVAPEVFDALRQELSDEAILEFTYLTAMYEMHATICRALRLEYDDVDERIVEVAAPEGNETRDITADISYTK